MSGRWRGTTCTERMQAQITLKEPLRKRIWQQIAREKIRQQARVLEAALGEDFGLGFLATKVRSGDAGNHEAIAARRYWGLLFGKQFRRDTDGGGLNAMLNYGYGVLRGITGRAVVAAGLHPSIGLFHHNRYNAYCLADDLMEPNRPLVDAAVLQYSGNQPVPEELVREAKQAVLQALLGRLTLEGEQRTLFDCVARSAVSLVQVLQGQRKKVLFPEMGGKPAGALEPEAEA